MGIKQLKNEFQIEHIVQRQDLVVHIGSHYIHDLITISPDGSIKKKQLVNDSNGEIWDVFQRLNAAGCVRVKEILMAQDEFGNLITVYHKGRGAKIERTQCEKLGWPNITVEGLLMHDNEFFECRKEAVTKAIHNNIYEFKYIWQSLLSAIRRLGVCIGWVAVGIGKIVRLIILRGY